MSETEEEVDLRVRWHVYNLTMREGVPPMTLRLSDVTGLSQQAVRTSLGRLAAARMVTMQPGGGEILMAGAFSAVPTSFLVLAKGIDAWGNCVWDALGIPATLGTDAQIKTSCADCGVAAEINITDGQVAGSGFLHFPLPPKQWWNDIVFT